MILRRLRRLYLNVFVVDNSRSFYNWHPELSDAQLPDTEPEPPGQHFQVRFEGYFEFCLLTEDADPRGLAVRITQGVLGELDTAADVWLESYIEDEPAWPAFAIHTVHSRIEEVRA